jgi:hypothetical protein
MRKLLTLVLILAAIWGLVFAAVAFHRTLWLRGPQGLNGWVAVPAAAAGAALLAALLVNLGRAGRYFTARRLATILNVALMCALAGGIVVVANVLAARRYAIWDWTFKRAYSLSERTRQIVETLPRRVTAHVLVPSGDPALFHIRGMLDEYRAIAPERFAVEYLNPGNDPEELEKRVLAIGVDPRKLPGPRPSVVIFASADPGAAVPRTKVVDAKSLFDYDYSMDPERPQIRGFKGEEQFTRAVLDVSRVKPSVAYFLSGQGEMEPFASERGRRIRGLETALENLSWEVKSLTLDFGPSSKTREVPEDCDVLAIIGPKTRFDDRELGAIRDYLERGGRVLLMAEPGVEQRPGTSSVYLEDTRLDVLLKDYGLALDPAMIHDPATARADFVFGVRFQGESAAHPITRPLLGLGIACGTAQPPDAKAKVQAILSTTDAAVAVKDLDAVLVRGRDPESAAAERGPFVLAAAVTKDLPAATTATAAAGAEKREARLVVVGDASIASDDLTSRIVGQMNFVLNAIAWLGERNESISIAAKPPEVLTLQLGPGDSTRLWLLSLVEVPAACVALALFVWVVRRA